MSKKPIKKLQAENNRQLAEKQDTTRLRVIYFSILTAFGAILATALFIGWQRGMTGGKSKQGSKWAKEVWFDDTSVTMMAPMRREYNMTNAYMLKLTDPSNIEKIKKP